MIYASIVSVNLLLFVYMQIKSKLYLVHHNTFQLVFTLNSRASDIHTSCLFLDISPVVVLGTIKSD